MADSTVLKLTADSGPIFLFRSEFLLPDRLGLAADIEVACLYDSCSYSSITRVLYRDNSPWHDL